MIYMMLANFEDMSCRIHLVKNVLIWAQHLLFKMVPARKPGPAWLFLVEIPYTEYAQTE